MTEERPRTWRAAPATRVVASALAMIVVAAAYVWVDPLIGGGVPRPRGVAQWATRIAAVLICYGGLAWLMELNKRVLGGSPPPSILPSSKRSDRDRAL